MQFKTNGLALVLTIQEIHKVLIASWEYLYLHSALKYISQCERIPNLFCPSLLVQRDSPHTLKEAPG